MISYDEAGRVLDEAVDALPEEIFRELNGGVNLVRRSCTDHNGLLVMGTYNVNQMGRYIEIYYGSFKVKYRDAAPDKCEKELVKTLKHELTHHIESLAMDRSLEKWDEQHVAELLAGLEEEGYDPLEVGSILFVDGDGAGLAEMAYAMFRISSLQNGLDDVFADCASITNGPLSLKAARASARYGAILSAVGAPHELTRELCEKYDVALCMTEAQANELAARWPELDERFMCLGDRDLATPRLDTQMAWNRLADDMAEAVTSLVMELQGGEDGYD